MRTYNILKEKARRFAADREIQELRRARVGAADPYGLASFSPEKASRLKEDVFDASALAARGLEYERLDQLVVDLLLGVR